MPLQQANDVLNHTNCAAHCYKSTPYQVLSHMKGDNTNKHHQPLFCSVYVMEEPLQSNPAIYNKWKAQSQVLLFSWVHECCKSLKFTFPNLWIGIGIIALLVEFSLVCFCICAMWLLSDDELSLLVLVGSVLSLVSCDNDKPANNCLYHNALIVPCFKLEA